MNRKYFDIIHKEVMKHIKVISTGTVNDRKVISFYYAERYYNVGEISLMNMQGGVNREQHALRALIVSIFYKLGVHRRNYETTLGWICGRLIDELQSEPYIDYRKI